GYWLRPASLAFRDPAHADDAESIIYRPVVTGSDSASTVPSFAGSSSEGSVPPRSVPAISSSGTVSLGMKPDFMPKYTACGWCATMARVDCSGSTAWPPDSERPIDG